MEPMERYQRHLREYGVEPTRAHEHVEQALGDVRFFSVVSEGAGRYKAAASLAGLVDDRLRGDLRVLLEAGAAEAVAERLAWLQSDERTSWHHPPPLFVVVQPGQPLPRPQIDPRDWALVELPSLDRRPDGTIVFAAWLLERDASAPECLTITAPPGQTATLTRTSPGKLLPPEADRAGRARGLLSTGSEAEKRWALLLLGRTAERAATADVAARLADPSAALRAAAADALGRIGDPAAAEPLGRAFAVESERDARTAIVHALGQLRTPGSVTVLARLAAAEPGDESRLEMVQALGESGDVARRALEQLRDHDASERVRQLAKQYLGNP